MKILTFDIEDWYNCDFISGDFDWDKYEVRIYKGIDRILEELDKRKVKGTFFCLGWIAEKHPDVVKKLTAMDTILVAILISTNWLFVSTGFKSDTEKSKSYWKI